MEQFKNILASVDIKDELLKAIRNIGASDLSIALSHPYMDEMGVEYDTLVNPNGSGRFLLSSANGENAPFCFLENLTASELFWLYQDLILTEVKSLSEDFETYKGCLEWAFDAAYALENIKKVFGVTPREVASVRIRQILEGVEIGTVIKFNTDYMPDYRPLPYILNAGDGMEKTCESVRSVAGIIVKKDNRDEIEIECLDKTEETVALLCFGAKNGSLIPKYKDFVLEPGCILTDESVIRLEAWLEDYERAVYQPEK